MGVSLNGGTPNLHSKMIILSRKTQGFVGETHHFRNPPYPAYIRGEITHPVTSSTSRTSHPVPPSPNNLQAETEVLAPDYSLMPPIEEFSKNFWWHPLVVGFWVEVGC